jgi:glycosyltransferase involved in cell wall biosynthesis
MPHNQKTGVPLSIAIITKDEEDRIGACVESLSFADEIVVVDSGSVDDTVRIAGDAGCRVILEKWRGYAGQKQFAVDQCRNDWVIILDADERIPRETAEKLGEIPLNGGSSVTACSFLRKNYFHGRWIRHCGWWPDRIVRLVNRKKGRFNTRLVHERWITDGNVRDLDLIIDHYSFRNYSDLISKMQTYSTLSARDMFAQGKHARGWTPLSHGLWMFLRTYIFEMGVLEGFDGFMISALNGGGSFMKYAKLIEMNATIQKD